MGLGLQSGHPSVFFPHLSVCFWSFMHCGGQPTSGTIFFLRLTQNFHHNSPPNGDKTILHSCYSPCNQHHQVPWEQVRNTPSQGSAQTYRTRTRTSAPGTPHAGAPLDITVHFSICTAVVQTLAILKVPAYCPGRMQKILCLPPGVHRPGEGRPPALPASAECHTSEALEGEKERALRGSLIHPPHRVGCLQ